MKRRPGDQDNRLLARRKIRTTAAARGWFRILFIVLVETGLRVKREALPLKWSDVDLDSPPGRLIVRSLKTVAGIRTAFLTRYCKKVLLEWRTITGLEFSQFIFANPNDASKHIVEQTAMEDNCRESRDRWPSVLRHKVHIRVAREQLRVIHANGCPAARA